MQQHCIVLNGARSNPLFRDSLATGNERRPLESASPWQRVRSCRGDWEREGGGSIEYSSGGLG